jgi:hypothetical protein
MWPLLAFAGCFRRGFALEIPMLWGSGHQLAALLECAPASRSCNGLLTWVV